MLINTGNIMLKTTFFSMFMLSLVMTHYAHAKSYTAKKTAQLQANLDQACEDVRDIALEPLRTDIYNECVDKFKKDQDICREEAAVYNGRRINGAPRFYELPECQKAFELREKTKKENAVR
jgi:hypothetical protein